jgi:hypothetical protein
MRRHHSEKDGMMDSLSRRSFLQHTLLIGGSAVLLPRFGSLTRAFCQDQKPEDEVTCEQKFALAVEQSLKEKAISEVIVAIGTSFIGTPYVSNALEVEGEERLVINMQGLDCVTFIEYSLALSRCIKLGRMAFEDYKRQVQLIRYRDGIINKFPSRLHYFSDWIYDNASKKIVRDVTREIGGQPYRKTISYMSSHRHSYRQLSDNTFLAKTRQTEEELTRRQHYYIPKKDIARVQNKVRSGDIIAITASLKGMDIAHTGVAIRAGGALKLLHAPIVGSAVQITEKPLVEYLKLHKSQTGIMIARPLEPAE